MRRLTERVVLLLALVTVATSATAADRGDPATRALVPKIVAAWQTLDITKVDPYYAKDAELAFFDLAPLKYVNWAEYRVGVQKMFFDPNKSLTFTIKDDLAVHRRGLMAYAAFTFGADVVGKDDKPGHLDGRWTMVLEQRGGRWTVVHEHVSVPLSGS